MGDIFVFVFFICIATFIFVWAISAGRNNVKSVALPSILIGAGITIVLGGAFFLAYRKMAGAPLSFLEPGKYTVIATEDYDDPFATNRYVILKDNNGRTRLYSLPNKQLYGAPSKEGVLEVTEIPSTQKMVFR